MSDVSGTVGNLFGTAIGFIILAQGIKMIRESERDVYRKKGYKIHPMHKLKKYQLNNKQFQKGKLASLLNTPVNIKIRI
jgi:hypothetical protein